ncbi:MAG: DNA mismatch repair protein [Longicatena sp.]
MDEYFIKEKINKLQELFNNQKKTSSTYSTLRFILVILIFTSIYFGYNKNQANYMIGIIALVIFIYLVRKHMALKKDMEDNTALLEVYQDVLARKSNDWKSFVDDGTAFLNKESTREIDLDIFGKASLYQYLCVAHTSFGKEKLASLLSCDAQSTTQIKERQACIQEFNEKQEFSCTLMQLSKLYGKHAVKKKASYMEEFFTYMEVQVKVYPKLFMLSMRILPCITLLCICASVFFQANIAYTLMACVASLCFAFLCFLKNSAELTLVNTLAETMQDYERLLATFANEQLEAPYLRELQHNVQHATTGIKKLNTILTLVRIRSNSILFLIVNALFLLDFQCVFLLESWKKTYGQDVRTWLMSVGEIEALLSLAQIGFVKENSCMPTVVENDSPLLNATHITHPLLLEKDVVANDFTTSESTYIITGSNMSGKTTFLRTLGINLVLFHAGTRVCANSFHATSMNCFTSMRVHDDVGEGISTFYAEILRIKKMMEESKKEEKMFVLIDEIFKGTNSADRILCAKQAIKRLHLPWVLTMVSTHDFELCDLEKDEQIHAMNYHFSEYYEDDKICFDYTLKNGKCTTTNAKELMKLAGF